jgi:succinyl-CoA synthetase beta subunit
VWLARPEGAVVPPPGVDVFAARAVVAGLLDRAPDGDWLLPQEVGLLCSAAALPAVPTAWAPTAAEARAAAARLGGPTVVKGLVRGVVHKADAGLLRLPVPDPAEVGDIVAEWARRHGADWLGAVVQPLAPGGDELLVGAVRDAAAGAVVALGAGGRATDALGHRVHRLAPLSDVDVTEMIAGTGLFGTPHGRTLAVDAVGDSLRRVGWLADALPEVEQIDVNPLIVTAETALALDVRVRISPSRD